jgi:5-methylcytosine-specific restriction endonuclease McrA
VAHYWNYRDDYKRRFRSEHGVSPSTFWKRRFREENGFHPSPGGRWIPIGVRQAVYDRDEWFCRICDLPIPQGGHEVNELFASLDHIEPCSDSIIPDDSVENLRMAHMICNAYRQDDRLTDEEVREINPAVKFLSSLEEVS